MTLSTLLLQNQEDLEGSNISTATEKEKGRKGLGFAARTDQATEPGKV